MGLLKVWWADQHNRLEWDIAFLAYLTLKRDSIIYKVSLVLLERRIAAIKFIAKLRCTSRHFCLMPINTVAWRNRSARS